MCNKVTVNGSRRPHSKGNTSAKNRQRGNRAQHPNGNIVMKTHQLHSNCNHGAEGASLKLDGQAKIIKLHGQVARCQPPARTEPGKSIHHPDRFSAATSPYQSAHYDLSGYYPIKPTTMAIFGPGVQPEATQFEQTMRVMTNMSPNYRGNPSNFHNHSQIFLDDKLNCSFWITGLPKDVTHKEIFDKVKNCGKVYALHINNALAKAGIKKTAAAKIIFFDVEGASRFHARTIQPREVDRTAEGLEIRGHTAFVVPNRNKVGPQTGLHPNCSRVLLVSGAPRDVNYDDLVRYFDRLFKFELEDVLDRSVNEKEAILEFRFAAWRAQATLAHKALKRDRRFRRASSRVKVVYTQDPCSSL